MPERKRSALAHRVRGGISLLLQAALVLVVLAGIAARIAELPQYVPDSGDEWGNAVAPLRVLYEGGNPGTVVHPALYYEMVAVVDASLFGILRLRGTIDPASSMTDLFVRDPRWFVFAARGVSVGSAVLAMAALYVLGRRLWNGVAGLVAAALLAVLPLHAFHSEAARVDSLFLASFLWAVVAIVRLLEEGRPARYALAGASIGLATATNYNGALLVAWLVAAHFLSSTGARTERSERGAPRRREAPRRRLVGALAVAGALFVAANPFALLRLPTFLHDVVTQVLVLSWSVHPGAETRDVRFYALELWATSPLLVAAIGASAIAVMLAGARADRFVLSMAVGYFALFSLSATRYDRFILPAVALGLLIAAGLPFVVAKRWVRWRVAVVLSVAILLPVPLATIAVLAPLAIPVPRNTMLPRADDGILAWLETNAAAGSTVLLESGVVPLLDVVEEPGPLGVAVRRSLVALRPRLDLRYVGAVYLGGASNYHADLLTVERVDYAVISMRNVPYVEAHCDAFAEVCAFYRDLRARGRVAYETPESVESAIIYDVRVPTSSTQS